MTFSEFRLNPNPDDPTRALLRTIILALNPSETPVHQPLVVGTKIMKFWSGYIVAGTTVCCAKLEIRYPARPGKFSPQRWMLTMLLYTLAIFVCEVFQYMWHFSRSTTYVVAPLAVPGIAMYFWMAAITM